MALARNIGAGQADRYYEQDDYYTNDQSPSAWHGQGAAALGLRGEIAPADFKALVRGQLPDGQQLHRGGQGERRAGTDFEFSAPKSFSIQALVNGDARLVEVHKQAVAIARERIEATTATRVTAKGKTTVEFTHKAVIAEFLHTTSRAGDPDLHSHVVALNLTQRSDGQWRSVDNTAMFREQRLMYEIYLSELARGAKGLGYEIATGKHGNPEVAHISRAQIEHFSARGRQVERALAEQGLDRQSASAAQKKRATLATRNAKQTYDRAMLQAEWQARGQAIGLETGIPEARRAIDPGKEHAPSKEKGEAAQARQAAVQGIDFALSHLSEREAGFSRQEVLVQALRDARGEGGGAAGFRDIDRELRRREQSGAVKASRDGRKLTTVQALDLERRLLAAERRGRDGAEPIANASAIQRALAGENLTVGQREAVQQLVTTRHRIAGVNGLAGSGKTTALQSFREIAEQQGYELTGLAPSHSAVAALNASGIETRTLQGWLAERDAGRGLHSKSVLVVDEAGLASNQQLAATLERAGRSGARVVLVGDVKQYQAVDAGRGFAQLQAHGMQTARMNEMLRQKTPQLAEAARLAVERPAAALAHLEVREIAEPQSRHDAIARDYAALSEQARRATLILTGTNEAKREINAAVRNELGLAGKGETFATFQRHDWTAAERKKLGSYSLGDAIRFEKGYRSLGVESGEIWRVQEIQADRLRLKNAGGREITIKPNLMNAQGFSVGAIEDRELAAGERVRFTATDRVTGYRNGERAIVEQVTGRGVTLSTGKGKRIELARGKPLALEHGYAATGHSAQGLGAARVLLDKDTQVRTTDHRSFYTDLTRAKESAIVYTNDRQALPQAITRQTEKSAALDVYRLNGDQAHRQQRSHRDMAHLRLPAFDQNGGPTERQAAAGRQAEGRKEPAPRRIDLAQADMASQEAVYDRMRAVAAAHREKRLQPILEKAARREERRFLARREARNHQPKEPQGLLAGFKRKAYAEARSAWAQEYGCADQLHQQAMKLAGALRGAAMPHQVTRWATDKVKQIEPELTRRVQQHRAVELDRRLADQVQKHEKERENTQERSR